MAHFMGSYPEKIGEGGPLCPCSSGVVAVPNGVLAAEVAGIRQEIVSAMGILQRALSRLALVRDSSCGDAACLVDFRIC